MKRTSTSYNLEENEATALTDYIKQNGYTVVNHRRGLFIPSKENKDYEKNKTFIARFHSKNMLNIGIGGDDLAILVEDFFRNRSQSSLKNQIQ